MKKLIQFLGLALFTLISVSIYAQSPSQFRYQAVLRDASGAVITGTVDIRLSFLEDGPAGSTIYSELHNVTIAGIGALDLTLGDGDVLSGNFNNLNWGNHEYWLKVELDQNPGSNNFIDFGTTPLLSVPYALYANEAGNVIEYAAGPGINIAGNQISAQDNSATNELQDLQLNGTNLSITNGNTVNLAGLGIGGSGTTNYLSKWSNASSLTSSSIFENNSGNVGIGTITPFSKLDVVGDLRLTSRMVMINAGQAFNIQLRPDGKVAFEADGLTGDNTLVIDDDGVKGVGIGTDSPVEKLHVEGNVRLANGSVKFAEGGQLFNIDLRTDGKLAFEADGTVGDNTLVIDDDADKSVMIGTSTATTGFKLKVVGQAIFEDGVFFGSIESLTDGGANTIASNSNINPTTHLVRDLGTSSLAWDNVNADDFVNISDARYKTNIQDLTYGLDEIMKLRPVTFAWDLENQRDRVKIGMIAQEVQAVIQEAVVSENYEFDNHTNTGEWVPTEKLGITYHALVPVLIAGIQEQQQMIQTMQQQMADLEAENAALRQTMETELAKIRAELKALSE